FTTMYKNGPTVFNGNRSFETSRLLGRRSSMLVEPLIERVFGHFQNLNLAILLEDLRREQTAQGSWSTGRLLCPVAHGMPAGRLVSELCFLGQAADPQRAYDYAARHLGAGSAWVARFIDLWDARSVTPGWVLRQL